MSIENLRKKIDKIDLEILKLLNQRADFVKKIGEFKTKKNKSFYAPAREKEIIQRVLKVNKGPLNNFSLKNIYKEILSSCLALEKPIKVAYLGPPATFTHMAVLEKFGSSVECVSSDSIPDVFYFVEKKQADYGVVPIENSTEGTISHTLDMFLNSPLKICNEVYINISHNLLSKNKLSEINKIYSNPQAYAQCRNWLRNNLDKSVELIEVSSTTKAAELSAKSKNSAAIASKLAASYYDLNIIAEDIQDNPYNRTRFLVIGDVISERSGKDKTSLMFSVRNVAGALYKALAPLQKYNINMTMIESRPTGQKLWEYVFFVDVQGYVSDKKLKDALKELEKECLFLKILGSYPEAE